MKNHLHKQKCVNVFIQYLINQIIPLPFEPVVFAGLYCIYYIGTATSLACISKLITLFAETNALRCTNG